MSTPSPRICVLADDLIWSSRLVEAVRRADALPARAGSIQSLVALLDGDGEPIEAVVVDLNGRSYDGLEGVRVAAAAGRRVLAVGQHEDVALRRRALDAGALRVYSYNKLFRDGPAVMAGLVGAGTASKGVGGSVA